MNKCTISLKTTKLFHRIFSVTFVVYLLPFALHLVVWCGGHTEKKLFFSIIGINDTVGMLFVVFFSFHSSVQLNIMWTQNASTRYNIVSHLDCVYVMLSWFLCFTPAFFYRNKNIKKERNSTMRKTNK